jgi:hypothetical protein
MTSNSTPVLSRYTTLAEKEVDKAKAYVKETWGNPMYIFVAAAISALVISLIFYLNFTNLFSTGAVLANLGWISTSGGLLLFGIIFLLLTGVAGTFGLSFVSNMTAMLATVGSSLVLGLLGYFVLGAIRDQDYNFFLITSILLIVVSLALAGYGLWSLWSAKKKGGLVEADSYGVEHHLKWAYGGGILAVLGSIGLGTAMVRIGRAMP